MLEGAGVIESRMCPAGPDRGTSLEYAERQVSGRRWVGFLIAFCKYHFRRLRGASKGEQLQPILLMFGWKPTKAGPSDKAPEVESGRYGIGSGEMVNYYKSPSPQERRYRDVLAAIAALSPVAKELADELDEAVWQIVNRAVDAAIADREGRMMRSTTSPRSESLPVQSSEPGPIVG